MRLNKSLLIKGFSFFFKNSFRLYRPTLKSNVALEFNLNIDTFHVKPHSKSSAGLYSFIRNLHETLFK